MRKMSLVNETLRPETETFDFQSETRLRRSHISPRPRRWENASQDRLETETSRPRLHPSLPCALFLLLTGRICDRDVIIVYFSGVGNHES